MRLIATIIILAASITSYGQHEDYLIWSKDRKINWSAFKGKPDNTSSYAAMSGVGIHYKYHATVKGTVVKVRFEIDTRFDKLKSWSKKYLRSDYILKHEQLHFDICEIVKRQFKREAESTTYTTNYKNEIKEMFNRYSNWLHQLQSKYDEQTTHSANRVKQKTWEDLIQQQLYAGSSSKQNH